MSCLCAGGFLVFRPWPVKVLDHPKRPSGNVPQARKRVVRNRSFRSVVTRLGPVSLESVVAVRCLLSVRLVYRSVPKGGRQPVPSLPQPFSPCPAPHRTVTDWNGSWTWCSSRWSARQKRCLSGASRPVAPCQPLLSAFPPLPTGVLKVIPIRRPADAAQTASPPGPPPPPPVRSLVRHSAPAMLSGGWCHGATHGRPSTVLL